MNTEHKIYERSVFIPDLQVPFIDEKAFQVALAFLKHFKPDVVFQLGDAIDFYTLSQFSKNPERLNDLQKDIDKTYLAFRRIRAAAPNAKIYYIKGNHEYRMTKYLWSTAAELHSLHCLKLEELLDLDKLEIEYVDSGAMLFHGFLVKHGHVVRAKAGYSGTGEFEKNAISGISGHTHRLSQVYRRNYQGLFTWIESGCLCLLDPEYLEGQIADWAHGLTYGYFEAGATGNRFTVNILPIIKYKAVYGGKEIIA